MAKHKAADAANDNTPRLRKDDIPVFDKAQALPRLWDAQGDWTPPMIRGPAGVPVFVYGFDGPSVEWRCTAQAARITSNKFGGQAANGNFDWPLQKLLRAEGADYHLSLAERYRDVWTYANQPTELRGTDMADNIYLMARTDLDPSTGKLTGKGIKKVTGKKAKVDLPATRAVAADPDKTKKRAKAIPRKWNGDWPLLHKIDCGRELVKLQAALGYLREGFEAAVIHGWTLEAIGKQHGVGNSVGAKGAGRALVMLGLQAVDEFWRKPANRAAA